MPFSWGSSQPRDWTHICYICIGRRVLYITATWEAHPIVSKISHLGLILGNDYWERSVFIPIPKKGNAKEHSNYHTVMLISHASKVMLKILQASSTWTKSFRMYKLDFKEAEEPNIQLPTFVGSWRKQRNSRKTSTCASLTTLKLWVCGSQQIVDNS